MCFFFYAAWSWLRVRKQDFLPNWLLVDARVLLLAGFWKLCNYNKQMFQFLVFITCQRKICLWVSHEFTVHLKTAKSRTKTKTVFWSIIDYTLLTSPHLCHWIPLEREFRRKTVPLNFWMKKGPIPEKKGWESYWTPFQIHGYLNLFYQELQHSWHL